MPPLPAPSLQPDSEHDPLPPGSQRGGEEGEEGRPGEVCFQKRGVWPEQLVL